VTAFSEQEQSVLEYTQDYIFLVTTIFMVRNGVFIVYTLSSLVWNVLIQFEVSTGTERKRKPSRYLNFVFQYLRARTVEHN
jgi:Sec-independent protein secretion pathway component TatC